MSGKRILLYWRVQNENPDMVGVLGTGPEPNTKPVKRVAEWGSMSSSSL